MTAFIFCNAQNGSGAFQLFDTAIVKKYDAGTLARLSQWAAVVSLSRNQEMEIADWYAKSDSNLKVSLLSGYPIARLEDREEDNRLYVFNNLLNASQQATYEAHFGKRFGQIAGQAEFEYLQEEFHPGGTVQTNLKLQLTDKYSYLYQRYLYAGSNQNLAQQNVKDMLKRFDAYRFYPSMYAGKYLTDYFDLVRAVRPVPDSIEGAITQAFFRAANTHKYSDWGIMLDDIARHFMPDTSLYSALHYQQFLKEAVVRSTADRYNLVHLHHVSTGAYDSISHLIVAKNYHNSVIQYTFGASYPRLCDSLIHKTSRYYDSCVEVALIRDGSLQPSTQFALALKNKEWLQLRPEIIDSLVWHAMYVSRLRDSVALKNPFAPFDTEAYESEELTALLSETEYTNLLILKNQPQALADAKKDWAEMVQRGIAGGLIEETALEQLTSYYVMRYSAWNRYAHDKNTQMANVRSLEENKPQCLKTLDYARWNATPAKAANNQKLQW
jgi:hypothetical protein